MKSVNGVKPGWKTSDPRIDPYGCAASSFYPRSKGAIRDRF
jgi:hypothetical protein